MIRPSRGLRESATTTRYDGCFVLPTRINLILTMLLLQTCWKGIYSDKEAYQPPEASLGDRPDALPLAASVAIRPWCAKEPTASLVGGADYSPTCPTTTVDVVSGRV